MAIKSHYSIVEPHHFVFLSLLFLFCTNSKKNIYVMNNRNINDSLNLNFNVLYGVPTSSSIRNCSHQICLFLFFIFPPKHKKKEEFSKIFIFLKIFPLLLQPHTAQNILFKITAHHTSNEYGNLCYKIY